MFRIMHRKGLALALSVALNLPGIAIAAENPTADASDYDARLRDLDTRCAMS
jgi:hypothetical protein